MQGFPDLSAFKRTVGDIRTSVHCWGLGSAFLTESSQQQSLLPRRLPALDSLQIVQVAISLEKCLVLTANNDLCEFSLFEELTEPTYVHLMDPAGKGKFSSKKIAKIACASGSDLFFALTTTGELFSWGSKEEMLGRDVTSATPANEAHQIKVDFRIVDVCVGSTHVLALSANNHAYSWGLGRSGRLGQGTCEEDERVPSLIPGLRSYKVLAIAAGWGHSAALTQDGRAFVWGKNDSGQLGLGEGGGNVDVPRVVRELTSVRLTAIACGAFHTAFLTELGQVYVAGQTSGSKSGLPQLVPLDFWCVDVVCGPFQTVAVCTKGGSRCYYAWGKNSSGEFGLGNCEDRSDPIVMSVSNQLVLLQLRFGMNCGFVVTLAPEDVSANSVEIDKVLVATTPPVARTTLSRRRQFNSPSAFSNRSLTDDVAVNGSVVAVWGNVNLALPHYSAHMNSLHPNALESPQIITSLSDKKISSVATSVSGAVFLASDGSIYTVSFVPPRDSLVRGSVDVPASPMSWKNKVFGRQVIKQIACNRHCCYAVTEGGALFSWLWPNSVDAPLDILGREGTAEDLLTPQIVSRVTSAILVVASDRHVIVLREDMQLVSWGDNSFGQLGHGDTEPRVLPHRIRALQPYRITDVTVGATHSVALTLDGKAFVWGCGADSQLGLGSTSDVLTPTLVDHPGVIVMCAAGERFTCFLNNRGELMVAGTGVGLMNCPVPTQIRLPFWCVSVFASAHSPHVIAVCENPDGTGQQLSAYGWSLDSENSVGFADPRVITTPQMVRCIGDCILVSASFGRPEIVVSVLMMPA